MYCTGLNEMTRFPPLPPVMWKIDLQSNKINDNAIDRILEWLQPLYSQLSFLNLERNALTKIPAKMKFFNRIKKIFLGHNLLLNATISSGSLFGSNMDLSRSLENMGILSIQSGAFQGLLNNFLAKNSIIISICIKVLMVLFSFS